LRAEKVVGNQMNHGITDKEWMLYLEGELDEATVHGLEAHLVSCKSCWDYFDQLAGAGEQLRVTGEAIRSELSLCDRALYRALVSTVSRINRQEKPSDNMKARLDYLRSIMAPMCGARTVERALKLAAEASPAKTLEAVSDEHWNPFLLMLTSIAAVMCGETAADLIWESGQAEVASC